MKQIKKMKLTQLRKAELSQREMHALKGGCSCGGACGCGYDSDAYGQNYQNNYGY